METRAAYTAHQAATLDRLLALLTAEQVCRLVELLDQVGDHGEVTMRRAGRRWFISCTTEEVWGDTKTPPG